MSAVSQNESGFTSSDIKSNPAVSASSSAGFGSIEDERIFAAMTSFNRCRRRFVASSRCVGMDRRYDSVPLIGKGR